MSVFRDNIAETSRCSGVTVGPTENKVILRHRAPAAISAVPAVICLALDIVQLPYVCVSTPLLYAYADADTLKPLVLARPLLPLKDRASVAGGT